MIFNKKRKKYEDRLARLEKSLFITNRRLLLLESKLGVDIKDIKNCDKIDHDIDLRTFEIFLDML